MDGPLVSILLCVVIALLILVAGITLPSSEAQFRNIRAVYEKSKLTVEETSYVECHGTGTQAGDWRELKAISDAFCGSRTHDNPIYVGSVKTNIGHLEGCAGIAGLIKGILTIENGMIPKHLNFEPPGNPFIDFEGWKVKVRNYIIISYVPLTLSLGSCREHALAGQRSQTSVCELFWVWRN